MSEICVRRATAEPGVDAYWTMLLFTPAVLAVPEAQAEDACAQEFKASVQQRETLSPKQNQRIIPWGGGGLTSKSGDPPPGTNKEAAI